MSIADSHSLYGAGAAQRGRGRADLSRTLKLARDRMASRGSLDPQCDRELLAQHASTLQSAAIALPFPVILTGFGLSVFTGPAPAIVWTSFALLGFLMLVVIGWRFTVALGHTTPPPIVLWTRIFLAGHVVTGLSWAYLATLSCSACSPLRFDIFQFSVIFLAIAMIAMVSSTLKLVVPIAFLPTVAILAWRIAENPRPELNAMDGVLIAAVPFFALIANTLRRNAAERIRNQAEKDDLIAELEIAQVISEEARKRAEEANLAKSRFLATMSHELRTPLNAILGFSEVMKNEILGPIENESYKEYASDIHASGDHLLGLINDILDLSRIEAGRYGLNEEAVDVVAVARDCLGFIKAKAVTKNIDVASEFEPDMPALWCDERAIRQVLINLLSNAVKFTPRGGTITLRAGWTSGGGQYLSVSDNGPGIPEDEIPLVLASFGQGSIAMKSAEQGTGLGLPIVSALMSMHGGHFDLISRLREGTQAIAVFPTSRVLEPMPAFGDYA